MPKCKLSMIYFIFSVEIFRSGKNLDVNSPNRLALYRQPFLFVCEMHITDVFHTHSFDLICSLLCVFVLWLRFKKGFAFQLVQNSAFCILIQLFFSSRIHSGGGLIPLLGTLVYNHTRVSLWMLQRVVDLSLRCCMLYMVCTFLCLTINICP